MLLPALQAPGHEALAAEAPETTIRPFSGIRDSSADIRCVTDRDSGGSSPPHYGMHSLRIVFTHFRVALFLYIPRSCRHHWGLSGTFSVSGAIRAAF